jgi:hypothetical protein
MIGRRTLKKMSSKKPQLHSTSTKAFEKSLTKRNGLGKENLNKLANLSSKYSDQVKKLLLKNDVNLDKITSEIKNEFDQKGNKVSVLSILRASEASFRVALSDIIPELEKFTPHTLGIEVSKSVAVQTDSFGVISIRSGRIQK